MDINMDSIMKKVEDWKNSPVGKRRTQAVLDQYAKEGRTKTAAGDSLIKEERINLAAEKFMETLRNIESGCQLPEAHGKYVFPKSVMELLNDVHIGSPVKCGDGYQVEIRFAGNRERKSLQPDDYSGVNNIIAVLNNGYDYQGKIWTVEGEWHGDHIHALPGRTGMQFIQQAVRAFNESYGAKYNVTAKAGDAYE